MGCKCKKPRPEEPSAGVPDWIVTYGDMMTLLLCFFILLAAFSELKKEDDYQAVVEAVKEAFGYTGGAGMLPTNELPTQSMIKILKEVALKSRTKTKMSQSNTVGMSGQFTRVKRVREGMMFVLGGNAVFDRESAVLKPQAVESLRSIGKLLIGRNNKIAVRGHADSKTLSIGSQWTDLDELSYARARAVKAYLVDEMGIEARRIFLDARGDSEPMRPRASAPTDQRINRRVEIILTENVIEDFNTDANYTDPSNARGG